MLYQIKIQRVERNNKKIRVLERAKPILLRPCVNIESIAFWQKRAAELLPDCHITCQVAK